MKEFSAPEVNVTVFAAEDIITASNNCKYETPEEEI